MEIQLKTATPADIPTIGQLAHKIWWAHYPGIIPNEQIEFMLPMMYAPAALEKQMREGAQFRLVVVDNQTIGFTSVSQTEPGNYFLHKFYIDNSQQRRGIGTAVFNQILATLPDLREFRLTVNRANFRSINFYFKLGFLIEKNIQIPIGGGFVMDDFQMLFRQ